MSLDKMNVKKEQLSTKSLAPATLKTNATSDAMEVISKILTMSVNA